jgi:DNA end-binding protein Ku
MPPRSSWKGYLRLSLVSVPVQAFNAMVSGGGDIHLNQLHADCGSRIRYKKVCPVHGEVTNSEIVSGYEYSKGRYVLIEPDELDRLRTDADRAINIDTFVEPGQIDPVYFDGRDYYLVPDGPVGQKPYAVLHRGMSELQRWAVGQAVFSGKEQLVLVRPVEDFLMMTMLHYEADVRKPSAFDDELTKPAISKEEVRLAETLIKASSTDKFDLSKYHDVYTERLTQLINAKFKGEEIVAPPEEEVAPVINLMDALRKSVAQTQRGGKTVKPPKKMAGSRRVKTAVARRKSS